MSDRSHSNQGTQLLQLIICCVIRPNHILIFLVLVDMLTQNYQDNLKVYSYCREVQDVI